MPKLTKEQLEKVKYVSIPDLYAKLDRIEGFDEKVQFATNYLLSHGMDGASTDCTFEEAIHFARLKLIDESKKLRDKIYSDEEGPDPADLYIDYNENAVNPYAEDEKDDIENQFFMGNPAEYLKAKAEKHIKQIGAMDNVEAGIERSYRMNCERLCKSLTKQMSTKILLAEEKGMNVENIKARLETKYGSRETFHKIEKETHPGFIARAFGTRSNAGKNFDEVYAAFNNPKHALYGNMAALERATTQYLDYKYSKKSAAEKAVGLAVKEPKEGLAENILKAIKEQKENDEVFKPIVGTAVKRNLTQDSVDRVKGVEIEENPNRVPLVLDLDDDNEEELDDSMESDMELDDEMEKQSDDPSVSA